MGTYETTWETRSDYYGPELYNENVRSVFTVVVDEYPAEPYSYGQSRGLEKAASATLQHIIFHESTFTRSTVMLMYGYPAVEAAEKSAAEVFLLEQD